MAKIWIIVVAVLAVGIFISISSVRLIADADTFSVVTQTEGFTGNTFTIPQQTIDEVFDSAKAKVMYHAEKYRGWNLGTVVLVWTAFLFSSVTTLIAGYWGQVGSEVHSTTEALMGELRKKRKSVRVIGLVAALATICTGASVKCREYAEEEKTKAASLRNTIIASYADLADAKSETDAFAVLEKLRLDSEF